MSWKVFVQWIGEQDFLFWVPLIVAVLSLVYAEIERRGRNRDRQEAEERQRQVEEQLRIAKEQATLRPKLEVSFQQIAFHYRPPNPGSRYVQAAIIFKIENTGRSVANNVRCEFSLDEQRLELSELHGLNRPFEEQRLDPTSPRVHPVQVGIREYGPTEAHYRCVCDEVGKTEGVVEFNVPENQP